MGEKAEGDGRQIRASIRAFEWKRRRCPDTGRLPMETYKNKNILADLSSLFEKDKDDYLPNVRGGFTGEDGKICYMRPVSRCS